MIKQQELIHLIAKRGAPTTNDKTSYTENPAVVVGLAQKTLRNPA